MSRMTLKDIAQELGLSLNTVSDVLNGGDTRYSEKTRKRIHETANRLGYRANRQAQILAGVKSGLIGIIKAINFHQSGVERALYAGEAIHKNGFKLLSYDILWHYDGLEHAVQTMLDARVEGVLIDGIESSPEVRAAIQRLLKARIPLISLHGILQPEVPHVTVDFYQAGRLLADHLLSLGYRRLAFIGPKAALESGDPARSIIRRLVGCRERVAEAQKSGACLEVIAAPAGESDDLVAASAYEPGIRAMRRILELGRLPDAIICSNDLYAIGALKACREAGVRVPDDLAIVGFDNIAVGSYFDPSLTSVTSESKAAAQAAVDLLFRSIREEDFKSTTSVSLPCTLVIRESCGFADRSTREAPSLP